MVDHVLGAQQPTQIVFDSIARDLILSVMNGFNGTIFAYGQTSSGKTHTMLGTDDTPGIIPLSMSEIFGFIVKVSVHLICDPLESLFSVDATQNPEREFLLRVSYLEIYNEVIKDLLNPENSNLKIHETPRVRWFTIVIDNIKTD
jgi:centromeric protein E